MSTPDPIVHPDMVPPEGAGAPLFPFDNSYQRLPDAFFARTLPDIVEAPRLIKLNRGLAAELGLDADRLETQGAEIFSGNRIPTGADPIAMAYAGHQFGQFVPKLGDGRAILLGEVIDTKGRRRDIQLKGPGRTPFSRRGDGRAALGPVLREYVVSEAMHALGLPTTRALAFVTTGQTVIRDRVLPGAVLTRVAASHIRVGTFQYFAARGDTESVKVLADYVIDRHYPEVAQADDRYAALLSAIAGRQAKLIAGWLHIGFIHGVMNTDNMAVSGETIDFGPCAFMDAYDPATVFSSIDAHGRYAYGSQPGIGQWNLARLAETLLPLFDGGEERAVEEANRILTEYGVTFQTHWMTGMRHKLGLAGEEEDDLALVQGFLDLLKAESADFTLGFRALGDAAETGRDTALPFVAEHAAEWTTRWRARLSRWTQQSPELRAREIRRFNPLFIPRNHRIEDAINAAIDNDDFSLFEALNDVLSRPYEVQPGLSRYAAPPLADERVLRTFCGT